MRKNTQQRLVVVESQVDGKYALLSQGGSANCKISQQMILKPRNSKQEKVSNYLIYKESYISFRFYTCSFKFIHCFLQNSQKGHFLSLVIHFRSISTWKWLYSQLTELTPSSVKISRTQVNHNKSVHFSSSWDLTKTKCC